MQAIPRRNALVALAVLILVTTLCVSTQTAAAASSTCVMPLFGSCDTGSVGANPAGNFVHIDLSPRIHFRVIDTANGSVVNSGISGLTGTRRTISPVLGSYYIHAWRTAESNFYNWAWATVNNN